ncbi:hypothetical protein H3147_17980 [Streptomyces sp. OF8]|uniref:Uncharacterized protein n=1 Tax=Streptomyces alkaliterrae TaxID=2213162 RepID=A0A5P0YQH8_9ACTN|nr:hypothetical protein [Streptomyces alkaliterrae]MQS02170.1 hypothetical protein [Streptomyces alkaliterrae]
MLLLGAVLITLAVGEGKPVYRDTVAYTNAKPCPPSTSAAAAPPGDCLGSLVAEIRDKDRTYRGGGPGGGDTTHRLKLLLPSENTVWRRVSGPVYEAAEPGGRAELTVWRGMTVGVTVDGEHSGRPPRPVAGLGMWALLGWGGAGLVLWSAQGNGRPGLDLVLWALPWMAIGVAGCVLLVSAVQGGFQVEAAVALTVFVVLPALYVLTLRMR